MIGSGVEAMRGSGVEALRGSGVEAMRGSGEEALRGSVVILCSMRNFTERGYMYSKQCSCYFFHN